jgi:hypothetical protein
MSCNDNVNGDGVFTCTTPLKGNFVGLMKINGNYFLNIAELRAYSWVPFD